MRYLFKLKSKPNIFEKLWQIKSIIYIGQDRTVIKTTTTTKTLTKMTMTKTMVIAIYVMPCFYVIVIFFGILGVLPKQLGVR